MGITQAKARALEVIKEKVSAQVEETLLDCLVGPSNIQHNREAFRKLLRMGHLDDRLIEIEVPEKKSGSEPNFGGNGQFPPMNEIILRFDKAMGQRQKAEKKEMLLKVRPCLLLASWPPLCFVTSLPPHLLFRLHRLQRTRCPSSPRLRVRSFSTRTTLSVRPSLSSSR